MLHYTTYKNNCSGLPWLTFIHGAGGSSSIWHKQIRFFSKFFNLLLIDLRGHGNSKGLTLNPFQSRYTFKVITDDIIKVLDHEKILKSHFVGISLGTILIRKLADFIPERVVTMTMAGAIIKLNFRSRILMYFGNWTKSFLPYIWIYRLFALIVMPNPNHRESRLLFVREAKKLYKKEFLKWYKLTTEIIPLLKFFRQVEVRIPTLYIMGSEDYLFLTPVRKLVKEQNNSKLFVIPNCGHVVNVENPGLFNDKMLSFIKSKTRIN